MYKASGVGSLGVQKTSPVCSRPGSSINPTPGFGIEAVVIRTIVHSANGLVSREKGESSCDAHLYGLS